MNRNKKPSKIINDYYKHIRDNEIKRQLDKIKLADNEEITLPEKVEEILVDYYGNEITMNLVNGGWYELREDNTKSFVENIICALSYDGIMTILEEYANPDVLKGSLINNWMNNGIDKEEIIREYSSEEAANKAMYSKEIQDHCIAIAMERFTKFLVKVKNNDAMQEFAKVTGQNNRTNT